ncbi:MAG: hypothetical protein ACFFCO_07685 [Promethearchaeota archaeon]
MKKFGKTTINFAKVPLPERAFTGCRNPRSKPNQQLALNLLLSRR